MNRLKDNRGETLIESLVSLLILTMTFAFLAVKPRPFPEG